MNDKTPGKGKAKAFFNGFISAFDISGQALISSSDLESGLRKDREAIKGDWQRVGDDMRRAMNIAVNEQ
jgi:hypothetical protein